MKDDSNNPIFKLLPETLIDQIIEQALTLLNKTGVFFEDTEMLEYFGNLGLRSDKNSRKLFFTRDQVETALKTAPSSIKVSDRSGKDTLHLEENNVHYDPGSAAIKIYDIKKHIIRTPTSPDYIRFIKITHGLEHMDAQSTSFVPGDVPDTFADRYRLYLSLLYSTKPVITGIFAEDALPIMIEMLKVIRDGSDSLKDKPLAIFDACPSPPLKWSKLTALSLIECAKEGIPTELVSMPLTGATSPVTLVEAVVQHCAENLSGITMSQMVKSGAPIIYGGSPAMFDMRYGTTPMGAVETVMIDCAYAAVGKKLGIPTHAYLGLSDAKSPDAQAGMESSMGLLLGTLSGVNMISGPGMLDFESTQSEEKLIIDNEICGTARRLARGMQVRDKLQADELLDNIAPDAQFLSHPHTLKWFREEQFFPGPVIDRQDADHWEQGGKKSAAERARDQADQLVENYSCPPLSEDQYRELTTIVQKNAASLGIDTLPELPEYF